MLKIVEDHLKPLFKERKNLEKYQGRAGKVRTKLVNIKQSHVGTDKSKHLIESLFDQLIKKGMELMLNTEVRRSFRRRKRNAFTC